MTLQSRILSDLNEAYRKIKRLDVVDLGGKRVIETHMKSLIHNTKMMIAQHNREVQSYEQADKKTRSNKRNS